VLSKVRRHKKSTNFSLSACFTWCRERESNSHAVTSAGF